jgi:phage terminase large subunit-like protein
MKIFKDPARYTLRSSRVSATAAQPFDWTGKRGCIVLDPAATKKTSSDYNAIGVIAVEGSGVTARAYIVDALKKRMTMPEAARMAVAWKRRYNLSLVIEGVGGFAGVHQMVQEIVPGLKIESPPMFGDKFTRAQPAAAAWNDGRFLVPVTVDLNGSPLRFVQSEETAGATWMDDVIEIAQGFTGVDGNEDDLVDMLAHGFNFLNGSSADKLRRLARW